MKLFKFTIRTKLLLLSIAVLSIPYVGFQYLRELEYYLRDSLENSLIDAARAVAAPLQERADLFPVNEGPVGPTVFVHKINHPVQIDGYTDDWLSYLGWSEQFSAKDNGEDPVSFRFLISRYQQYFYLLVEVRDRHIVYQQPDVPDSVENDHIALVFTDPGGELKKYYFSPAAPGNIRPFQFITREDEFGFEDKTTDYITNVNGVWQPVEGGYNFEMAIPAAMVGEKLGLIVNDVDDAAGRKLVSTAGTAGAETASRPGKILQPSPEIEKIIETIAAGDGRRIWVLNNHGQVLAGTGDLIKQLDSDSVNLFYKIVLPAVHQRFKDDLSGASRLEGEEITRALAGEAEGRWRTSPDGKAVIVSAAAPVWSDGKVRGVVVVEEATTGIQMQQRQAMASLFNKTLFVFIFVTLLLLVFATRLSYRLRKLGAEAEASIDEHGRVAGEFSASRVEDEIGELSRNYAAMLERLKQYNDYLEKMAGRLSHELRTPITVVQSSLDHLHEGMDDRQDREPYLTRARDGIDRLNLIVTRLSEATRLEQALQTAEKRETDVARLLTNCVEGYRLAYPEVKFKLDLPEMDIRQNVSPDLLVQMLDKLVSNAVDFSRGGDPIEIALEAGDENWKIHVTNYGSSLPGRMEGQLFNSMVSVREKAKGREPHLGLGLYIVRLIVEYHGGMINAKNINGCEGVTFSARFPRHRKGT